MLKDVVLVSIEVIMDKISALLGLLMGYFTFSIGSFLFEYIINKSNGNKWGYKITKVVLVLNVAIIIFGIWFDKRRV